MRVMCKIKQNELDCRDTASLTSRFDNAFKYYFPQPVRGPQFKVHSPIVTRFTQPLWVIPAENAPNYAGITR